MLQTLTATVITVALAAGMHFYQLHGLPFLSIASAMELEIALPAHGLPTEASMQPSAPRRSSVGCPLIRWNIPGCSTSCVAPLRDVPLGERSRQGRTTCRGFLKRTWPEGGRPNLLLCRWAKAAGKGEYPAVAS